MKISPLASGGTPGANLGSVTTSQGNPERLAAAKAIAAGETPIKVTQEAYVDPQAQRIMDVKRLKMKTNASPERYEEAPLEALESAPADERAVSDTTEQATAAIEDTKPLSPQFAALAKQRRALQVKERELADREKALVSTPANDGSADLVSRIKSEPLRVLQEHGVTYDQLTEAIIANQSSNPEIQQLRDELKALKAGVDKTLSDKDVQAEQAVLAEMRKEAQSLAASGEAYEMVRETNSLPEVMDLIYRTYKSSGEVLEVSDALQLVEDHLINESLKIANINKVKGRLTPTQALAQQNKQPQVPQKGMKTLTNRDTSSVPLSAKARAMMAFHGNLKK